MVQDQYWNRTTTEVACRYFSINFEQVLVVPSKESYKRFCLTFGVLLGTFEYVGATGRG